MSKYAILFLCLAAAAYAQPPRKAPMPNHATGTFEVKLTAVALADTATDSTLGRRSIDKQFHGDLEAASKGEMLSAMTAVKGSVGYVAIERVAGTLHGRKGTFVLQHSGSMTRGAQQLAVTVVPDSGTADLTGLSGQMTIIITEGRHSYDLGVATLERRLWSRCVADFAPAGCETASSCRSRH